MEAAEAARVLDLGPGKDEVPAVGRPPAGRDPFADQVRRRGPLRAEDGAYLWLNPVMNRNRM
ncbi:hypothetical protein GCM10018953_49950 [Streptosporangium nondiastaticum]